jgi:Kef-type K+ transport system membrane component KefB
MSSVSVKKGVGTRLMQALALCAVFALLFAATRVVREFQGASELVGALGFLLLAGILLSELCELVGLPHLSGYLVAGILAGPHVLHLVDHSTVERLGVINTLTLALIALAGGAELRIEDLREGLRSLGWSMLIHSTLGFVIMSVVFVALARFLPFTRDLSFGAIVGIGLLWGVIAVSRSPSATLGVLAQLRPKGPVTQFSLAFVMSSDVVVVLLLAVVMGVARPLIDAGSGFSFESLGVLAHEIVGSVALGTTLGLCLAIYLRLIGGQLLLVILALGYGVTEGLRYLHFDPLLAFLIAGFVVQNFSQQGGKFLHAVEQTAAVVFVVFFATAGAHLDLPLLSRVWPVALALAGGRAVVTLIGHLLATRLAGDPPIVRRWGWASLISQAGLTLGLAAAIERVFPALAGGFAALVIGTVAINEMVGPVLFKLALDRTRETGKAGRASLPPPEPARAHAGAGP